MNKITLLVAGTSLFSGCFDSSSSAFRSSQGLDTSKINIYVFSEVHTHVGDTEHERETHTTIQTEFYGYDKQGYQYIVELAESDQLSVSAAGEAKQIAGAFRPNEEEPSYIEYSVDFDQIEAGTEFRLNLDRSANASSSSVAFYLPEETPFTAMPISGSAISMTDTLTLDWQEAESKGYRLRLRLHCFSEQQSTTFLPDSSTRGAAAPLVFTLSELFTLPVQNDFTRCELHSILHTSKVEDLSSSSQFESSTLKVARQQSIIHLVNL